MSDSKTQNTKDRSETWFPVLYWNSDSVYLSLSSASDCCVKPQTFLTPPTPTRTTILPTPEACCHPVRGETRGGGVWLGWEKGSDRGWGTEIKKNKQKKAKRKTAFDWCYVPSLKRGTPETPSWSVSLSSAISLSESKENVLPASVVNILGSRRVVAESVLESSSPLLLL